MLTDDLEELIASARLARYRAATATDEDALALYVWNSKMCAAYCEALSWIEVGLRNRLAELLRGLHESSGAVGAWWDVDEPWFDPWFEGPATEQLVDAAERLRQRDQLTHGHMIAELQFGFWVRLLARRFEASLWTPALRHAFERGVSRRAIERQFAQMNRWRNRAAHHECMLERDLNADWASLQEAAGALHTDLARTLVSVVDFPNVAARRPLSAD